VIVIGAFGVIAVRMGTEIIPAIAVNPTVPAALLFPGTPPVPAWPNEGEAAISVDGIGTFGSVGGDMRLPIASMAKMMTAYIILKDHPMAVGATGFDYTVTAADVADLQARVAQDQSTVPVTAGEKLTEYQLLQALLIPSGDNIAAILATYDAGTLAVFVVRMNVEAATFGMHHTIYTDPSGYLSTTVSTASDQVALGQMAMREPVFAQIVAEPSATLPVAGLVHNVDTVVGTSGFIGIKTGSDSEAGGCFTFANVETVAGEKVTIVGAVLAQGQGSNDIINASFNAASTLVKSVVPDITEQTLVPIHTRVATAVGADQQRVPVETTTALRQIGWGGLQVPLAVTIDPPGRNLKAGQVVAEVNAGAAHSSVRAAATSAVPAPGLSWRLEHIL
jgi:D-alanyl-D-alanine carboxypeptidase (penicillin-binding protein 5/6)